VELTTKRPVQLVVVGASGDLTQRKLIPALAAIAAKHPDLPFEVVGVARRPKTDDGFRAELREALPEAERPAFDALAPRLRYFAGDVADDASMAALGRALDGLPGGAEAGRLFYFSLKPELFAPAARTLARVGLLGAREGAKTAWRRVVIEKPFGHDLASARTLNHDLHELLYEEQIFRIDHYLGKETVQNIIGLRFHNAIFEPVWNRTHVELIQITVAEDLGMESGRAGYYDGTARGRARPEGGCAPRAPGAGAARLRDPRGARALRRRRGRGPPGAGLPLRAGGGPGLGHRDLRRGAGRDRQLALGGRTHPAPAREAAPQEVHRGAGAVQDAGAPAVQQARRDGRRRVPARAP
jgi:hypothetical protein